MKIYYLNTIILNRIKRNNIMENIIESIVTTLRTQLQPYVNDMKDQRRIYDAMVNVMEMMPEFQKVKLENKQLKEQLAPITTTITKELSLPEESDKVLEEVAVINNDIVAVVLEEKEQRVLPPTNNGIKLIILEKPVVDQVEDEVEDEEVEEDALANEVEAKEVEQEDEVEAKEVEQEDEEANEVEQEDEEANEVDEEANEVEQVEEEDADEEFSIEEIDGYGNFYVSDKGNVYSITPEEDVGDFVGTIKDGVPAFI
jgi:hypothetical protein